MSSKGATKYFSGLDTLRGWAATAVVVHHLDCAMTLFGMRDYAPFKRLMGWECDYGTTAVSFFFVLSGFLITYLLLVEKQRTGDVSIRGFYWRRILRIWPAYYFVVLTAFFVVPRVWFLQSPESAHLHELFGFKLAVFLLLMPNLSTVYQYWIYPIVAGAGQLWTIGVEEQFYALWPWAAKKIKNPYGLAFGALGMIWGLTRLLHLVPTIFGPSLWSSAAVSFCWGFLRSELPVGAVFAVFYLQKPRFYPWLTHPLTVLLALLATFNHFWRVVDWESSMALYVAFAVLILRVVEKPPLCLRFRVFEYLGKTSYGVYMLHYFVVYAAVNLLKGADLKWIYAAAVAGTYLAAIGFYEWVEKPILRHKNRIR